MRRALMILTVSLAALAGCSGISYEGNENSPYYHIPVGSRLTLNQELTIPADQVAVFLQDGRVPPSTEVKHYYPYCRFELYSISDQARTVTPDELTIVKTVQHMMDGATGAADPVLYAQLSFGLRTDMSGDAGGPSIHVFATRMDLRSTKQPDIFRLTCAQWGYPVVDRHVTIAEIRRAVGDLFTLHLARQGG